MKMDYISPGAAAMARLRQAAAGAQKIQQEQLRTILRPQNTARVMVSPASIPWQNFRNKSRSPVTKTMSLTSKLFSPAVPVS